MYPGLKLISSVNGICLQHSARGDHWAGPATTHKIRMAQPSLGPKTFKQETLMNSLKCSLGAFLGVKPGILRVDRQFCIPFLVLIYCENSNHYLVSLFCIMRMTTCA